LKYIKENNLGIHPAFSFIEWKHNGVDGWWLLLDSDCIPNFLQHIRRPVYILDDVPHKSNGTIIGAKYKSDEEAIEYYGKKNIQALEQVMQEIHDSFDDITTYSDDEISTQQVGDL